MDINKATGIYGIYIDEKVVYIGKTTTSFSIRFSQHKSNLKTSDKYLYRGLRKAKKYGAKVTLRPLIILEELKVNKDITDRDINMMELALIQLYQPKYNIQGMCRNYVVQG